MTAWDLTTRGAPTRRRLRNLVGVGRKHAHDPDSAMTHALNVARRNGTPYQPRHCGCQACSHGFTHIAQVVV